MNEGIQLIVPPADAAQDFLFQHLIIFSAFFWICPS